MDISRIFYDGKALYLPAEAELCLSCGRVGVSFTGQEGFQEAIATFSCLQFYLRTGFFTPHATYDHLLQVLVKQSLGAEAVLREWNTRYPLSPLCQSGNTLAWRRLRMPKSPTGSSVDNEDNSVTIEFTQEENAMGAQSESSSVAHRTGIPSILVSAIDIASQGLASWHSPSSEWEERTAHPVDLIGDETLRCDSVPQEGERATPGSSTSLVPGVSSVESTQAVASRLVEDMEQRSDSELPVNARQNSPVDGKSHVYPAKVGSNARCIIT